MKVLIIDDSKVMRRLIASYIEIPNIETSGADDGLDALEILKEKGKFDFALVDWDMPRMNGLEFVKAVRANSEYDSMKMMMVTAHNAMEDVGEALKEGANDFLMKPFSKEMIEEKLRLLGLTN